MDQRKKLHFVVLLDFRVIEQSKRCSETLDCVSLSILGNVKYELNLMSWSCASSRSYYCLLPCLAGRYGSPTQVLTLHPHVTALYRPARCILGADMTSPACWLQSLKAANDTCTSPSGQNDANYGSALTSNRAVPWHFWLLAPIASKGSKCGPLHVILCSVHLTSQIVLHHKVRSLKKKIDRYWSGFVIIWRVSTPAEPVSSVVRQTLRTWHAQVYTQRAKRCVVPPEDDDARAFGPYGSQHLRPIHQQGAWNISTI